MKATKIFFFALSATLIVGLALFACIHFFSVSDYAISKIVLSSESINFLGLPNVIDLPVALYRGCDVIVLTLYLILAFVFFRKNRNYTEQTIGALFGMSAGIVLGIASMLVIKSLIYFLMTNLIIGFILTTITRLAGGKKFGQVFMVAFSLVIGIIAGLAELTTAGLIVSFISSLILISTISSLVLILRLFKPYFVQAFYEDFATESFKKEHRVA